MAFLLCILAIFLLCSTPSTAKSCLKNLTPLYRLYHPTTWNHFYTTSLNEANNAADNLGYTREGSPGLVATSTSDCECENTFKPIYRLYKSGAKNDHFYTLSEEEAVNAATNLGYQRKGIAFYCVESPCGCNQACGASSPFYRYWRGTDHFYTTDINEGSQNVVAVGGTYEGIMCYIWPASTSATNCRSSSNDLVVLERLYRSTSDDHFYTTSVVEAVNAIANLNYKQEVSPGLVSTNPTHCKCGKKLQTCYRLYRAGIKDDHFYTTSDKEANSAVSIYGYKREGIAFYCAAELNECGASLPLYRYLRNSEHFFTTDPNDVLAIGAKSEGITCYIWKA